jgi:hypothetical protein
LRNLGGLQIADDALLSDLLEGDGDVLSAARSTVASARKPSLSPSSLPWISSTAAS